MSKTEERRTGLSGRIDPKTTPPWVMAFENLVIGLPRQLVIDRITQAIIETWAQDKETIALLEPLKRAFHGGDLSFRKHIRTTVYPGLPIKVGTGRYPDWGKTEITRLAAPKLKAAILREILAGWKLEQEYPNPPFLPEDARTCYEFVCGEYRQHHDEYDFWKEIEEIFRAHLEHHWGSTSLDEWILDGKTPGDIALIMVKSRARKGGNPLAFREIGFMLPFDLEHRSQEAITCIQEVMIRIRRTEEATKGVVRGISPEVEPYGPPNTGTKLPWETKVTSKLENPDMSVVTIVFPARTKIEDMPGLIEWVQGFKESYLSGLPAPQPKITITATGYGFSYGDFHR